VSAPRVTVLVRSYNRLEALCELVEVLLGQRHDSFEVIVVEQSTVKPDGAVAKLAELERDPRLTILRVPPQGGSRARNLGVQAARGDIVVTIDDDDLPMGDDFLTLMEAPFLEDATVVGATCRHFWKASDEIGPFYRFYAWRRCMRFAPLTKVPYTYPRYDRPIHDVDYVHGTGGAYRRSIFERFGGWDEDAPIEDEGSLAIRVKRGLAPGEHLVFDPRARLQRRMGLDGGLGKRLMTTARFYNRFLTYVHHILGRYFPWRVRLLYPLYVWAGYRWTVAWMWDDSLAHDTIGKKLLGTIGFTLTLPWHAIKAMREPFGTEPGSGLAVRDKLTTPRSPSP
jgi:glycosyltransferase involved in cell wall biosynthesis